MIPILAELFPHALAVSLSPFGIAGIILLVLTTHPIKNSLSFALGWFLGIFAVVCAFSLLAGISPHSSETDLLTRFIYATVGILLLYLGINEFQKRPKQYETVKTASWMQKIETITTVKAVGLGFFLSAINAKNTVIDMTVGIMIGKTTLDMLDKTSAIFIFSLVGSAVILGISLSYVALGKKLDHKLLAMKSWFIANNNTILFVIFTLMGALIFSKAVI